ncbi:MAG TPA: preprotein translocase subunit SecE [Holophagaceae bacterium]|nr:preprotein translocase subunit SecE [Holophagaceae bacterium]
MLSTGSIVIGAIKQQARDLFAELDRVDWPSKEKVLTSAWTVVIVSVFVGVYLWSVDWVLSKGFAVLWLKTR